MKVVLVGAGAQAKYALDIFQYHNDIEVVGILDVMENEDIWGKPRYGTQVLGGVEMLQSISKRGTPGALVCCADPGQKKEIVTKVQRAGLQVVNAFHPRAVISPTAQIGCGVIINAGAVIQPFAKIGNGVMIHSNVVVEHDDRVEDYVNIGPGATLAGWVTVNEGAIVYTGAVIVPRVTIGRGAVVGAGSVVLDDVPDNSIVVGIPAQPIKRTVEK